MTVEIKTKEIAGWQAAFENMRFPHNSVGDSNWELFYNCDCDECIRRTIGPNDLKLSHTLIKAGPTHAKHMRGIMVWAEITAPDYWWDEATTYEVGITKLSSSSTMHGEFKHLQGEELQKARREQPRGVEYKRTWIFNYQSLRNIYQQRKNHRLPEWKQFCEWIESLPLSKELITL